MSWYFSASRVRVVLKLHSDHHLAHNFCEPSFLFLLPRTFLYKHYAPLFLFPFGSSEEFCHAIKRLVMGVRVEIEESSWL